jgi:hypothetical protein
VSCLWELESEAGSFRQGLLNLVVEIPERYSQCERRVGFDPEQHYAPVLDCDACDGVRFRLESKSFPPASSVTRTIAEQSGDAGSTVAPPAAR